MLGGNIADTSTKDTTKINVSEHDSSVDKTISEPPDEGDNYQEIFYPTATPE